MRKHTLTRLIVVGSLLLGVDSAAARTHGHWQDVGTRITTLTRGLASLDDRKVQHKYLSVPMRMIRATCHLRGDAGSCRVSICAHWFASVSYTDPAGITTKWPVPPFIETETDHVRVRGHHVQVNTWGGTITAPTLMLATGAGETDGLKIRSCTRG